VLADATACVNTAAAAVRPLPGYEAWTSPFLVPGTQLQTFKDGAALTVAEVGVALALLACDSRWPHRLQTRNCSVATYVFLPSTLLIVIWHTAAACDAVKK
jgi:hypothetical protein